MEDVFIQNIIESMPVGLIVINTEGEIITTNSAAETILGVKRDVLKTKGWVELFFDREGNLSFNQVIVDVIEHQTLNQLRKIPYEKPDGEMLFLSVTSSFLRDGGEPVGIVLLFDDITELHELHEREKSMLEEKHRLQMERVESLKHFASSIAHQLRNPLVTIGGFANRMLKNTGKDCPNAELILNEVKRIEMIVQVVEEYTAISGIEKKACRLDTFIDTLQKELNGIASELDKHIEWGIILNVKNVFADPEYFSRALRKIFMNSLDAFKDSGKITILSQQKDGETVIDITDTGEGIAREDLAYAFDPFFTTRVTSIGMGLCTTQRIISEHHGTISIRSVKGEETTVKITLPDFL